MSKLPGLEIERDAGVAFVTIDSPPMNLLGAELLSGLTQLNTQLATDEDVRVVVFRSADPDFFVAHGDVEGIVSMPRTPAPAAPADEPGFVHQALEALRLMPKVTIAQIEGYARGGGSEFTLACDMRFAAIGRATFGQPEIGLGILPGAGGTVRLTQLVGRARACEIIFGGDDFDAEEAARMGWINRALPADRIAGYVDALARRIASFPGPAIAQIKRVIAAVESQTASNLCTEEHAFAELMAGPEARPRMQRFLDRGMQTREGEPHLGRDLATLAD